MSEVESVPFAVKLRNLEQLIVHTELPLNILGSKGFESDIDVESVFWIRSKRIEACHEVRVNVDGKAINALKSRSPIAMGYEKDD
jgi:hypothetical protein